MKFSMIIAIIGLLLYLVGYVFSSWKQPKNPRAFSYLSYGLFGAGLASFTVGAFLWSKEVYQADKTYLAYLSCAFAALLLLALCLLSAIKKRPNWLTSLLMGVAFVAGVAFLISMVALSQDAILNGINGTDSSSSSI